jgi:GT2 family glycosyltransferase
MPDDARVKLGVVIPLFNQLAHTQAMLASLRATLPGGADGPQHEVVLVDDGSTDGTREWLATLTGQPGLRVVLNPSNLGFAAACNEGAAACPGAQVLAFLNNDLRLTPGWLQPMWQALLHQPALRAGVVGNVQYRLADDGSLAPEVDHAGVQLTPAGQFEHLRAVAAGAPAFQRTLAATGACLLLRRADFDAVGGFDTAYRNGCEDLDLCFKLRERGLYTVVATESRIGHHVSASRGGPSPQDERNSGLLFGRWRALIKRELAAAWGRAWAARGRAQEFASAMERGVPPGAQQVPAGGGMALAPWLPGHLTGSLGGTPHAAAQTLAEAALQRHEHRWALELDGVDLNAGLTVRPLHGLQWHPAGQAWALQGEAAWAVQGVRSLRDFHVCGRLAPGVQAEDLEITLCGNGVHEQTFPLAGPPANPAARHVNVGLVNPLVLPGLPINTFTARVTRADPSVPPAQRPAVQGAVWVTHLVVDGKGV